MCAGHEQDHRILVQGVGTARRSRGRQCAPGMRMVSRPRSKNHLFCFSHQKHGQKHIPANWVGAGYTQVLQNFLGRLPPMVPSLCDPAFAFRNLPFGDTALLLSSSLGSCVTPRHAAHEECHVVVLSVVQREIKSIPYLKNIKIVHIYKTSSCLL